MNIDLLQPRTKHLGRSLVLYFFAERSWWRVVIALLACTGAIFGIASPLFQKIFVDRLLGGTVLGSLPLSAEQLSPFVAITFAFLCSLCAQGLGLAGSFLAVREGAILQKFISEQLYRKALEIRSSSLGSTTVGEIVSLYATDVSGATALIDQVLPMAAMIFFNLLIAPLAVQWLCAIPAWQTAVVIAGMVAFILSLSKRQSRFFGRFKQLAAERTGLVNEWVQNIRLLRILGWVSSFEKKIFKKREEETDNRVAMVTNGQFMNAVGSSMNFALNLSAVAVLIFFSGRSVTPGELFALLWIFAVFLARPLRQIPWFFTFTFDSFTSIRRLERFLQRESDAGLVDESSLASQVATVEALGLSVRGLNLAVNGQVLLDSISFDVKPGEFVAIVGEVGSGKSILAASLLGETGAQFTRLQIGGQDALPLSLAKRREYFSFVPQESFVMTASLRENVIFSYQDEASSANDLAAIDSGVLQALEVAQFKIKEELQGPGLDTEIGERGVNLSGGQRQRVALARAFYHRRPIVLLDDCLSAVDVDTEKHLLSGLLLGAWKNQTRILITHRLSVLDQVDRVLFVEGGRLIEEGPFAQLLSRSKRVQDFVASVMRSETARSEEIVGG